MDRIFSDSLVLEKDQYNHIVNSLRHRDGDLLEVVSRGRLLLCKLVVKDKNNSSLIVVKELKDMNLPHNIHIYQAVLEKKKIEDVLKLNVQLGVKSFTFFESSRVKPHGKIDLDSDRIKRILEDGSMQSKSSLIPTVKGVLSYEDMLNDAKKHDLCIFLYESELDNSFLKILEEKRIENMNDIAIIIGPEGGFKEEEVELAKDFLVAKLFPRILRTEVAAFSASSIIMAYLERYYES